MKYLALYELRLNGLIYVDWNNKKITGKNLPNRNYNDIKKKLKYPDVDLFIW